MVVFQHQGPGIVSGQPKAVNQDAGRAEGLPVAIVTGDSRINLIEVKASLVVWGHLRTCFSSSTTCIFVASRFGHKLNRILVVE